MDLPVRILQSVPLTQAEGSGCSLFLSCVYGNIFDGVIWEAQGSAVWPASNSRTDSNHNANCTHWLFMMLWPLKQENVWGFRVWRGPSRLGRSISETTAVVGGPGLKQSVSFKVVQRRNSGNPATRINPAWCSDLTIDSTGPWDWTEPPTSALLRGVYTLSGK